MQVCVALTIIRLSVVIYNCRSNMMEFVTYAIPELAIGSWSADKNDRHLYIVTAYRHSTIECGKYA